MQILFTDPPTKDVNTSHGQKHISVLVDVLKTYDGHDCKFRSFRELHHLDVLHRVELAALHTGLTEYTADTIRAAYADGTIAFAM